MTAADAAAFIRDHATDADLDILDDLFAARGKVVRAMRGSIARIGARVQLTNMSPKYYNGLVGTVASLHKSHTGAAVADLKLDPASAARLADAKRDWNPDGLLEGIPLTGLSPAS